MKTATKKHFKRTSIKTNENGFGESSASLGDDSGRLLPIRVTELSQSKHHGLSCSEQPASTHRRPGDSSPAARTCPELPDIQQAENLLEKTQMKTDSIKNEGSKVTEPEESNEPTAQQLDFKKYEEAYKKLPNFGMYDENASCNGEDVTDEHRESVRRFFEAITRQAAEYSSAKRKFDRLKRDVATRLSISELMCLKDNLVSMQEICAEIAPEIPLNVCFSRLRTAGILSNCPDDWNEAFGEPVEKGWIRNLPRCFRGSDGSHRGCLAPYLSAAGIFALKQRLIEALTDNETQKPNPARNRRSKKKGR